MDLDQDSEAAALSSAITAFLEAFSALDWDQFRSMFTEDATVIFPRLRAERATARNDVEATWQATFDGIRAASSRTEPPYHTLEPRDQHIQWLDDVAIVTFHLSGPSGTGRRTLVWQRTPDGWRIAHLHASNIAPP